MLLIRGAEVYAPEYLGKKDVLVAGGKIERIADHLPDYEGAEVIDGEGKILTPGIIDSMSILPEAAEREAFIPRRRRFSCPGCCWAE